MPKDHFNRDLDDYLHRKKNGGKSAFSIKLGSKPNERGILDATMTSKRNLDKKVTEAEIKQVLANKPKDPRMPELEPEEEPVKKSGFFSKLFGGMFSNNDSQEDISEEQVAAQVQAAPVQKAGVSADVAEVLKIAGRWLNKLDAEAKAEFKNSTDYAKYKYLLEKIKKQ